MRTHDLIQGSTEWLAYRASHFNASDAPAMMGCSPYKTRAQLLREMHTGLAAEVDAGTQKRFDNGHRLEALARPLAEKIIGGDLYPVTGSEGRLSASFDGLTLDESEGFEHKQLGEPIRAAFVAIDALGPHDDAEPGRMLPIYHRVQMEQQLHVSGAERILFMGSEWDADGNLVAERHCWYYPDAELRAAILRGWDQFAADLAAYSLPDSPEPAPAGRAPDTLPALRIEVTGQVTASNLAEFKATALSAIRSVNRTLTTDADFADAEKAVKWCADVESRLAAAKQHALSQTASIDALFKTIDDIGAEARAVRLDLDKLVTRRKSEVKDEAVSKARRALDAHIAALNAEIAPMRLPTITADFAGVIKGKRSITAMQDALDGVLTVAKIAAEADARAIRTNVTAFEGLADGMHFLFADLGQLIHKPADDFKTLVQARIATHRAAEAERERKRKEAEDARIAAEAQRLADQQIEDARVAAMAEQRRQDAAAESARVAAAAPASLADLRGMAAMPAGQTAESIVESSRASWSAPAPLQPILSDKPVADASARAFVDSLPRPNEPATLNLGTICGRLGFTVSAAFLADVLHITPAAAQGASKLYRESQFALICSQLRSHVGAMAELYAGEIA